jgi:hypothetical protein
VNLRAGSGLHAASPLNRSHVLIRYGVEGGELHLIPEADRRAVDPPIEVEAASWSAGGQLDWWIRERQTQHAVRSSSVIGMRALRSSAQQRHDTAERPADRE